MYVNTDSSSTLINSIVCFGLYLESIGYTNTHPQPLCPSHNPGGGGEHSRFPTPQEEQVSQHGKKSRGRRPNPLIADPIHGPKPSPPHHHTQQTPSSRKVAAAAAKKKKVFSLSPKITVVGRVRRAGNDAPTMSLLAEALRLLDGQVEFLQQLVVGAVGREVEAVEAGVAAGQPGLLAHLLDAEALGPVAPCHRGKEG